LLVDDICTSGATLKECVRVLTDAGAESVVCVTLAHAREKKKT
jgi:predicted amidophosphoribosyltransferase